MYFLNIIIVIQEIKNSSDICNISLIGQRHICLWNHGYFRRCHRNVLLFKCLMYRIKIFRSGSDLKAVIRIGKIFCTCIKCKHHQIITIHITFFFVNDNLSFFIEHIGYASLCTDTSLSLGKCITHIGCCTILIIRQALYNNCCAAWSISLIRCCLVINTVSIACRFFDTALDGIIRHIV